MSRAVHHLSRTFEYVEPNGDITHIETRIAFTYRPGRAATWNDPAEGYVARYKGAERQDATGKWVPLIAGEWLDTWCHAALDATEEYYLVEALSESGYGP